MSRELDTVREAVADYLNRLGVPAAVAWPAQERLHREKAVAVVTLRAFQWGPAGFQTYLGERYNQETGQWEELYGHRARLTFGLDLYAPAQAGETALQTALDDLALACAGGGPDGLTFQEFSSGETVYDQDSRLLRKPAQAVCTVCLYAAAQPGGTFLDFEIRGEQIL